MSKIEIGDQERMLKRVYLLRCTHPEHKLSLRYKNTEDWDRYDPITLLCKVIYGFLSGPKEVRTHLNKVLAKYDLVVEKDDD